MARLLCTNGFCQIDAGDRRKLSGFSWRIVRCSRSRAQYVVTTMVVDGCKSTVRLHRFLLDVPRGVEVDHVNGDGLDNRRSNLRCVTRKQNAANIRAHNDSSSKYVGVSWVKAKRKWLAQVCIGGQYKFVGYFDDEEEAASARDLVAKRHSKYAHMNFAESS